MHCAVGTCQWGYLVLQSTIAWDLRLLAHTICCLCVACLGWVACRWGACLRLHACGVICCLMGFLSLHCSARWAFMPCCLCAISFDHGLVADAADCKHCPAVETGVACAANAWLVCLQLPLCIQGLLTAQYITLPARASACTWCCMYGMNAALASAEDVVVLF